MNAPWFFDSFPHLDSLLAGFGYSTAAARSLHSPNAEDDEFIRCGMVGFARHISLDHWDFDHFRYVQAMRDGVSDGTFSDGWRRFTCLAAGYFLGMRIAGLINDVDLKLSAFHTAGFMNLHPHGFDRVAPCGSPEAG